MNEERETGNIQRQRSDSLLSIAKSAFSRSDVWISLGLIAASVLVYAPVRQHDFVNLDDPDYLTKNANVAGGLTWHAVSWAFTTGLTGNWHPLTWLSHLLDVQMFGMNPGPRWTPKTGN